MHNLTIISTYLPINLPYSSKKSNKNHRFNENVIILFTSHTVILSEDIKKADKHRLFSSYSIVTFVYYFTSALIYTNK